MDDKLLLTVEQVADRTQLKPRAVYGAVRAGDLRVVRIGKLLRFRPDSVDEWLRGVESQDTQSG